eukprot:TRINITY_DN4157_c0_g1_i3.p2 TRINITY_DN4157_c0_g1~~TRINITY_DN4157_c0_g1_i3.p2  ORF type:complete len:179 (-),score=25.18 TRINITY_DN4157_c0_g1_i3:400-936(-)
MKYQQHVFGFPWRTLRQSTLEKAKSKVFSDGWIRIPCRLLRALFELAREHAPSIVVFDEMDSIGRKRSGAESETERRIKTEFLRQMDGVTADARVHVLATTNMPWELDVAALRRFERRVLLPIPDRRAREEIFKLHLNPTADLSAQELKQLAEMTDGYSFLLCPKKATVTLDPTFQQL